jgi:outer membrane protein assembly factor BamB
MNRPHFVSSSTVSAHRWSALLVASWLAVGCGARAELPVPPAVEPARAEGTPAPAITTDPPAPAITTDPSAPWAMFAGDAANRGRSRYVGARAPVVKWRVDLGERAGYGFGRSPTIGRDGTIYLGDAGQGRIRAFSRDGALRFVGPESFRPPTIAADGTLWSSGREGIDHFDAAGRSLGRWSGFALDFAQPYLLASGGVVTIGAGSNGSIALLHADGRAALAWEVPIADAGSLEALAVGEDGTIYACASADGTLFAVQSDGAVRWRRALGECYTPTVAADGTVYVGDDRGVAAVRPDGSIAWRRALGDGRPIACWPSLAGDGTLIVRATYDDSGLYAVTREGALRWRRRDAVAYEVGGRPLIDAEGTIFNATAGRIEALAGDGTLRWSYEAVSHCGSPAIDEDGTTYVACGTELIAFAP